MKTLKKLFFICIPCLIITSGCNKDKNEKQLQLSFNVQNLTNPQEPDGSIDLKISGGIDPYQIKWSNGDSTEDIVNISSGKYVVTVKDALNDSICDSTIVEGPPVLLYFGQSYFEIISRQGIRIVADPSTTHMPNTPPRGHADVVIASHSHTDHTSYGLAQGYSLRILPGTTDTTINYGDVSIVGYQSEHGKLDGTNMGSNTIYIFTVGDKKIAHLGENREITEANILTALQDVDIMLAPAGEAASMSIPEIFKLADKVNTGTIIPHHYCYDATDDFYGSTTIDEFLDAIPGNYELIESDILYLDEDLGDNKVLYLHPVKELL
ncbi:MBL fold metallo-hydrolase [Bacteroidota bacterium]